MSAQLDSPSFDIELKGLNDFILQLVDEYNDKKIRSWGDLDERVKTFFTPERMDAIEAKASGWKKMASYSDGITLTHVTCVFLGMFMLPEFQNLTQKQQQIAKWIILFHDIDKFHIRGKKDSMHAFRSAIIAAKRLPRFGFPVTDQYHEVVNPWSELTYNAFIEHDEDTHPKPDNQKLSEVLSGIDQLFGDNTPAALIVKTVLLHISLDVDPEYSTPSPLTTAETKQHIDQTLFPLLKVMMLSDSEGWTLFHPEARATKRRDALTAFAQVEVLIK